jgi:hypothetical protein
MLRGVVMPIVGREKVKSVILIWAMKWFALEILKMVERIRAKVKLYFLIANLIF